MELLSGLLALYAACLDASYALHAHSAWTDSKTSITTVEVATPLLQLRNLVNEIINQSIIVGIVS